MNYLKQTLLPVAIILFVTNSFSQCAIKVLSVDTTKMVCGKGTHLYAEPRWVNLDSVTNVNLNAIFFTSLDTGYMAGNNGRIFKTTNGGNNWTNIAHNSTNIHSLFFTSADTGYAAGDGGMILKTSDGGSSWQPLNSGTAENINSIYFTSNKKGYAVGTAGIIISSADAGANWTPLSSGISWELTSIHFPSDSIGYVTGNSGGVIKTSDAGSSWSIKYSASFNFHSVWFTNDSTGYVGGTAGNSFVIKTKDGGNTWDPTINEPSLYTRSIFFVNADTGYVAAKTGLIYRTTDAGNTWTEQNTNSPTWYYSIFFVNGNTGYACGNNGGVVKLNSPVSYTWSPAAGLSTPNAEMPYAAPTVTTTYTLNAITADGCTAVDSVTLRIVPLTLNLGADRVIVCGGSTKPEKLISNNKDSTALHYSWMPGIALDSDTIPYATASPTVTTQYTLAISTDNGCMVSDSFKVTVSPLFVDAIDTFAYCHDSVAIITINNYSGSGALTYHWQPSKGLSDSTSANPSCRIDSNMVYRVTMQSPNGCLAKDSVIAGVKPQSRPELCLVGVDSSSKNMLVWNKQPNEPISTYNIYRETWVTDVYDKIGTVQRDSFSVFIDTLSNPTIKSNKYKMSVTDQCFITSDLSLPHKTMHLAINKGIGNTWNLIWEGYEGFVVSTYNVYRGTHPDSLVKIGGSSGSNTQYSDPFAPSGDVFYQVEVVSPNFCNPSKSYSSSLSNIATNKLIGVNGTEQSLFVEIFPNPSYEVFQFNSSALIHYVEIFNSQGEWISQIEFNNYSGKINIATPGFNFLRIHYENGTTRIHKLVKL